MNGTTAAVVVAAVLGLIAIVVARSRKRQRSEWEAATTDLGMEPVSALDPALTAAIIALHRPPLQDATVKQTWTLTRIYRYPEPGVNAYSVTIHLELVREGWRSDKTLRTETRETRVVAIVTPNALQESRMQLAPRAVVAEGGGTLATMAAQAANAMIDSAAEQGGDRVEFADDPEFERRYLVLSSQPPEARAFLGSSRRRGLIGIEGVQMSLEGSLLLVSSPTDAIQHRGRSLEESLKAEMENARRVLAVFKGAF